MAQILNTDRHLTCDEIAYEAGASVYRILMKNLNMRKIATRWIPLILSESEKQRPVIISEELLARHTDKEEIMLKCVVSIDETWLSSFEPELKCQNSEWHTKNSLQQVPQSEQLQNVDNICV